MVTFLPPISQARVSRGDAMQQLREAVMLVLRDLADVDAQRAFWLTGHGRRVSEPIELSCELFDDTGLGDRLSVGPVFSGECDELLRRLGKRIEIANLEGSPSSVLEGPGWRDIVVLAQRALGCLSRLS